MTRRASTGFQLFVCCALSACAQILGADEIDYSLSDGGSSGMGDSGQSGNPGGSSGSGGSSGDGTAAAGTGGNGTGASGRGGNGGGGNGDNGAGDGGAGADGGGGRSPRGCEGSEGPVSINIDDKFCIDSTEVTLAQYLEFLDAVAAEPSAAAPQPAGCEWNVTGAGGGESQGDFEPPYSKPYGPASMNLPVQFIDWCDAWSYCRWAGKRLCGSIEGAPASYTNYNQPDNELYYACSHRGERLFPYGNAYQPDRCVGEDRTGPLEVTSSGCEGGFEGVYDLSGNVGEWQQACGQLGQGFNDNCRLGAFSFRFTEDPADMTKWSCGADYTSHRATAHEYHGIRCCSDVR